MNDKEPKLTNGKIPTELSKDDLLKYVELDLWSKFQERLWKIVGIVITIVTILGLLGVPYYIKTQVTSHLVDREKEFTQRTKDISEYSKLLTLLRGRYDGERYRLDGDVLRVIDILERTEQGKSDKDDQGEFNDPVSELFSLISRSDFADVVENPVARHPLEIVPDKLRGKSIMPPTIFTVAGSGLALAAGGKEPHPIKDGTYEGVLKDLKFRILILEALRRCIDKLQADMLALGNTTPQNDKVITVDSLQGTDFQEIFSAQISSIANQFLNQEEKETFQKNQTLYELGYKVNYVSQGEHK
jgi:hypothetical protein